MNADVLSQFAAEVLARTDVEDIFIRVRAGAKVASMQLIDRVEKMPDTTAELIAAIEDLVARSAQDPENRRAYVEAVLRGEGTVVKRLPVNLDDEDNGSLNLVPAKGTTADAVMAMQLVRSAESWERLARDIFREHTQLWKHHTEKLLIHQELVTDGTVRAQLAADRDNAEIGKQIVDVLKQMGPALNLYAAQLLNLPPEQVVAMMGAMTGAHVQPDAEGQPAASTAPPADLYSGDANVVADEVVSRIEWLAAHHADTLRSPQRLAAVFAALRAAGLPIPGLS